MPARGSRRYESEGSSYPNSPRHPQPRRSQSRGAQQRPSRGCGCLVLTLIAVIAVIGLVGATTSLLSPITAPFTKQPIPDDVPPAAAEAAPRIDVEAPGRTSEQLAQWAAPIAEATGIPAVALQAYGNAEVTAAISYPHCNLHWNTLAGLGKVETRHGTYTGKWLESAEIHADGVARPYIVGPQLNGDGFAEITDTDNGVIDGDPEYDRAVGPMQFIPETWQRYGVDASGDGVADPHNIDDAAMAAARLLCSGERDLSTPEGWTAAIRSYNNSAEYVRNVRDAAANYALNQPA